MEQTRDYHIVRSGETLFTIAWRYGKDYRDLARWNDLGDGSLIYPGQLIRLYPPPGMPAASRGAPAAPARAGSGRATGGSRAPAPQPALPSQPPPSWAWPTDGAVVVRFGQRPGTGTGVLIGGNEGQPVRAAAGGRVVYSGSGLIGYGQLIIIKHNDTYLSAYGHNASLLVQEGEVVAKGQPIARMGEGPGREPRLHFEIRRNGEPVDPLEYLPARTGD
ncbi:MAG TPA: peptidoglycan DD-metalloendopeptidase family protein [Woeseiaceae bacterium]